MAIDITMPALSPTMESGTLAKWLVKPGDAVKSGDVIAEIETDKATMEVEAVDEGEVLELLVAEGAENVKVNSVIARLKEEGEDAEVKAKPAATPPAAKPEPAKAPEKAEKKPVPASAPAEASPPPQAQPAPKTGRVIASPLARRIAAQQGIDLSTLKGSGPNGRIVRADVEAAPAAAAAPASKPAEARPAPAPAVVAQTQQPGEAPYEAIKLSNMRRVIARRLSESKQTVPHFYLTVDIRLDPLLELRQQLNTALEKRGVKLSVNDLLLKAQAVALVQVPDANVSFQGDHLRKFSRPDISVAVAIPGGLITPVIRDAAAKSLSTIATEMKELAARAREGKLQPPEYTGGTASISNLGMYGIKQFDAVINPPEGLILAVGAGEKRPYVVNDQLAVTTVLSATGSFDHRAIDGAVGAEFMAAFKALVEQPIGMLA